PARSARCRTPLVRQVSRRRNAERTVCVAVNLRERVVEKDGRPLPADEWTVERRQQRAGIDVRVALQLVLPRCRVGDDLDDVGEGWIRPHAIDWLIQVGAASKASGPLVAAGCGRTNGLPHPLND